MLPHFIISLPESETRRKQVREEIKKLGLTPHFFEAVDGRKLSDEEIDRLCVHPVQMLRGEIGCALSHLAIYRKMVAEAIPAALIFVDDFRLNESKLSVWPELEQFVCTELLGTSAVLLPWAVKGCFRKVKDLSAGVAIHQSTYGIYSHAYFITKEAAANILRI